MICALPEPAEAGRGRRTNKENTEAMRAQAPYARLTIYISENCLPNDYWSHGNYDCAKCTTKPSLFAKPH